MQVSVLTLSNHETLAVFLMKIGSNYSTSISKKTYFPSTLFKINCLIVRRQEFKYHIIILVRYMRYVYLVCVKTVWNMIIDHCCTLTPEHVCFLTSIYFSKLRVGSNNLLFEADEENDIQTHFILYRAQCLNFI